MIPTKYTTPLLGLNWLEYYSQHDVYHPGIDLGTAGYTDLGNDVVAAKSGFVVYTHDTIWNSSGFGKFIIIEHADGTFTRYAHLADIVTKDGQEVKEGKLIGHLGNTGTVSPHLHFEVMRKECLNLQLNHWRKWRMYPSGWSKLKVQEYYLNPWEWLKDKQDQDAPDWAKVASLWAKNEGIITNFEGGQITDYELALVLYRFHKKYIKDV